jgi:hypothetical protein
MSFRLIVQLPGDRSMRGYSECALASEAFSLCRHLAATRVRVVEIFDLRDGDQRAITSAELEAIAQRQRLAAEQRAAAHRRRQILPARGASASLGGASRVIE